MTNRTIRFTGQGFGNVPVTVTATANGNIVYQGEIHTVDQPLPLPSYYPDPATTLFDLQIPLDFVGSFPMSIACESGYGMFLLDSTANYNPIPNPIYTPEQFAIVSGPTKSTAGVDIFESLANPPLTQQEIDILSNPDTPDDECDAILAQHGLSIWVSGGADNYGVNFFSIGDSRTEVALDGIAMPTPIPRPPGYTGDWTWVTPVNSTLTFVFNVNSPGVE
jgi:hypothetical protein